MMNPNWNMAMWCDEIVIRKLTFMWFSVLMHSKYQIDNSFELHSEIYFHLMQVEERDYANCICDPICETFHTQNHLLFAMNFKMRLKEDLIFVVVECH